MVRGLGLLVVLGVGSALTVRESGEHVLYNSLCKRYEYKAPAVRHRGAASDEVAIFLVSESLSRYCSHAVTQVNAWAGSFPSVYTVVGGNVSHEGAHATHEGALWGRAHDECPLVDAQRDPSARRGVKGPFRWRLVRCGDNGVAPLLLAPRCRAAARCCGAAAAMRAFLDRAATTFRNLRWWLFVDGDDLYVRERALLASLSLLDSTRPLSLAAPDEAGGARSCENGLLRARPAQAVAAWSRAAIETGASAIQGDGLARQCAALALGDDAAAGLAAFSASLGLDAALVAPVRGVTGVAARGTNDLQFIDELKRHDNGTLAAGVAFRRVPADVLPLLRHLDDDGGLCVDVHPAVDRACLFAAGDAAWAPLDRASCAAAPATDACRAAAAAAPKRACVV